MLKFFFSSSQMASHPRVSGLVNNDEFKKDMLGGRWRGHDHMRNAHVGGWWEEEGS